MTNVGEGKTIISTTAPDTSGQARVDLVKRDFDGQVQLKGYDVLLERAIKCPCRSKEAEAALSSCKNCAGVGWVFLNKYSTKMIIQSANLDTKYKEWAEERIGTIKITALSEVRLTFMDRITMPDAESVFNETVYPKVYQNQARELRARTVYPIKEVQEVFAFEESNKKLKKLEVNTDYTILQSNGENSNILIFDDQYKNWKNFTVSIRYVHAPQFHVLDLPRELMISTVFDKTTGSDKDVPFPVHAVGRRAEYILDELNYGGDSLLDNSYDVACAEKEYVVPIPTHVTVTMPNSTTVTLDWLDVSQNETSYIIERAGPDQIFSQIAVTAPNTNTYTDTPVDVSSIYFYRIATREGDKQSKWSETIGVITNP